MPLSATFNTTTGQVRVTMDRDLELRTYTNFTAWTIRIALTAYTVTAGSNGIRVVTLETGAFVGALGADIVDYAPPPNNIRNAIDGAFAAAFNLTPTIIS